MPKVLEETEIKLTRDDILSRTPLYSGSVLKRTPGVHLSGVLKYIAQTSGISDYQQQVDAEEHPVIWALGIAWEEFCCSLYPETLWQPGEIADPVLMTCDGHSINATGELVIEEFKWTSKKRKSGADFLLKEWLWLMQGRGYAIGYGSALVRWHVCWCNRPWEPVYVRYLIWFTPEELTQTRKMIQMNIPRAEKAGYAE